MVEAISEMDPRLFGEPHRRSPIVADPRAGPQPGVLQPRPGRETEKVFTRIVAAHNGSPCAQRALDMAVRLAHEEGADLIAVAVERSLLLTGDTIAEVQDAHTARERTCTGWLADALAYADERGAALHAEIRIGLVPQQLAGTAAAHHADLLVVGRGRRSAIWRRLFGTTTQKVSRRARCPTLIVP